MIVQLNSAALLGPRLAVALKVLLVVLAFVGCGTSLALRDYVRGMLQSASVDVAGIRNKKALEKKIYQIQERGNTLNVGVLVFDMNNLKLVNDNYGHDEGDRFIRTFASFLTRILTSDSFLARYGGDEFVIIEENATVEKLEQMCGRLQKIVDQYNVQAEHTISYAVGYEVSYRNHYYLIRDLLKIADGKMYQDKLMKKKKLPEGRPAGAVDNTVSQNISLHALSRKVYSVLNSGDADKKYAFVMADVKDFHLINDYCGYQTGNAVLKAILTRIVNRPETVFAYHFHSDVFVSIVDVTGEDRDEFVKKISTYNQALASAVRGGISSEISGTEYRHLF